MSANIAFLERYEYYSLGNVLETPILDITSGVAKNNLSRFLQAASKVDKNSPDLPRLRLKLRSMDSGDSAVEFVGYPAVFDGESVVEVQVVAEADKSPASRIKNFPWRFYFSMLCLALVIIGPNFLLPSLNINNTPKTFLPADAPSVLVDQRVRQQFPDDEVIVLLFEGVALYSQGFLNAYDKLTDALLANDQIADVIGVTRQDHITSTEDGFLVEPLLNVDEIAEMSPDERMTRAIGDRFARSALVAEDGSAIAMVVIPEPLDNSLKNRALEREVLKQIDELQLTGYLTAMAGEITTDVAQMKIIQRDNMIFTPATTAMGLLLIWFLFRRRIAVITTGLVTSAVVSCTIAGYVVFDQPFNSISGVIPPLLSALTIAALIHFYNALHYASKRGLTGERRVKAALEEIRRPALFSALTTSAGLASLGLSPIPPIRNFGFISAIGVFIIYLIVIHLLPAIYARIDRQDWPSRNSGMLLMNRAVASLYRVGVRYPLIVCVVFIASLGALAPNIAKIKVETDVLEFFHPDSELRTDIDHIEDKLVGTLPLEFIISSEQPEGLIEPHVLQQIDEFEKQMAALPEVDKAVSIADFVEEMHWGFNGANDEFRRIPENAELITQYLFVYDGEDIYDFINDDFTVTRIPLNLNVHGANDISRVMEMGNAYLRDHMPEGITWEIAGAGRMFADQEDLLIEGQVSSLGGALVLIFILMLALWRSLKDALICMIPNLSPVLLIFILMGVLNVWLDMATAMIASVAVGIAIDDTIHVYHGFIQRVRKGISPVLALARTYHQAGRAVLTTTVILCSQFLLLLFSAFVPMSSFGLFTSIGLMSALLFDLLLLPAVLILIFRRRKQPQTKTAVV